MAETIKNLVQLADLSKGLSEFAKAIGTTFIHASGNKDLTIKKEVPILTLTDTNSETQISNSVEIKKNADSLIISQDNNQIEFVSESDFNENNLTISSDEGSTKYPILHTGINFLYGVCKTEEGVAIKQVNIPSIKKLYNGLTIQVYFTNKNTVQDELSLKINNDGNSYPIYKNANKPLSRNEYENYCGWKAETCLSFTYYNSTWLLNSNDLVGGATQDFAGLMSSEDKQKLDNINSKLITDTADAAGWYRIAETPLNTKLNLGLFLITGTTSGYQTSCLCSVHTSFDQTLNTNTNINILDSTHWATDTDKIPSPAIDKIRVVYNTTYNANSAYLEVHTTQDSLPLTLKIIDGYNWKLISPVEGAIPTNYLSTERSILQNGGNIINFSVDILANNWTPINEEDEDYLQEIDVPGILATDEPFVELHLSKTGSLKFSDKMALIKLWEKIYEITTEDNIIKIRSVGQPTITIPIRLKVIRK